MQLYWTNILNSGVWNSNCNNINFIISFEINLDIIMLVIQCAMFTMLIQYNSFSQIIHIIMPKMNFIAIHIYAHTYNVKMIISPMTYFIVAQLSVTSFMINWKSFIVFFVYWFNSSYTLCDTFMISCYFYRVTSMAFYTYCYIYTVA